MELLSKTIKDIEKSGGKVFFVGGFVRDEIIGIKNKDVDLEVFYLSKEEVERILEKYFKVKEVGVSFQILLAGKYEFTITNKSGEIEKLIKSSAERRDFTINSLYKDALSGNIYDFFNGRKDITNKIIRMIDEKNIKVDPLRILRMAQFKARFEFNIEKETESVAKKDIELLGKIPKERIYEELDKIMLKTKKPSISFRWLEKIGYLEKYFPEIANLRKIEQGKRYHPEGDVLEHTFLALDVLKLEERDIETMLAILLHDVGKGEVKTEKIGDNITFHGHASKGEKVAENILKRITNNKEIKIEVKKLVKYHMSPINIIEDIKKKQIKKMSKKVDFIKLMKVHKADILGKTGKLEDISFIDDYIAVYNDSRDEMKPLIKGQDLIEIGMNPGPYFGKILKDVYEKQLNEEILTKEEALEYVKRRNFK